MPTKINTRNVYIQKYTTIKKNIFYFTKEKIDFFFKNILQNNIFSELHKNNLFYFHLFIS